MRKSVPVLLALAGLLFFGAGKGVPGSREVRSYSVREIVRGSSAGEDAFLARPVAMDHDLASVYVVDAEECAVKIFSKEGAALKSLGRKGQGPGEFSFPSGISVRDGRILVADKFNFRIQVLDLEGAVLGGFRIPFAPDRVFWLSDDTILVTRNPLNRGESERMLCAYDTKGRPLWEAMEPRRSGDPVYDAFMNMILVAGGSKGEFYVIHKCRERTILRFDGEGQSLGGTVLDEGYAPKSLVLPFPKGKREIRGVCWSWSVSGDAFFLLAPDYTADKDLGPGREIFRFEPDGRLSGIIRLPAPMIHILVDGDRIYAVDEERELRIMRISE